MTACNTTSIAATTVVGCIVVYLITIRKHSDDARHPDVVVADRHSLYVEPADRTNGNRPTHIVDGAHVVGRLVCHHSYNSVDGGGLTQGAHWNAFRLTHRHCDVFWIMRSCRSALRHKVHLLHTVRAYDLYHVCTSGTQPS